MKCRHTGNVSPLALTDGSTAVGGGAPRHRLLLCGDESFPEWCTGIAAAEPASATAGDLSSGNRSLTMNTMTSWGHYSCGDPALLGASAMVVDDVAAGAGSAKAGRVLLYNCMYKRSTDGAEATRLEISDTTGSM